MRKQLTLMLMSIFLLILGLQIVYAFEFDNVKSYDKDTKIVTIKDSILGIPTTKVADAKLTTEQVQFVPANNKTIPFAELWFNLSDKEYYNYINGFEVYNIKDGMKPVYKDITIKVKSYYLEEYYTYKEVCEEIIGDEKDITNKTKTKVCTQVEDKLLTRTKINWTELDVLRLDKGYTEVGLFADIGVNERMEWIPTIMGVRVGEWAIYDSSVNTGLMSWWKLNESTGTKYDSLGIRNATISGGTLTGQGIIGNAFQGDSANYATLGQIYNGTTGELSINFWFNGTTYNSATQRHVLFLNGQNYIQTQNNVGTVKTILSLKFNNQAGHVDIGETGWLTSGKWRMITITAKSDGRLLVYSNGTLISNTSAGTFGAGLLATAYLGYHEAGTNYYLDTGQFVDELSIFNRTLTPTEIISIYANHNATTYTAFGDAPIPAGSIGITLNNPTNNKNTNKTSPYQFNYTITPNDANISNSTLTFSRTTEPYNTVSIFNNSNALTNVTTNFSIYYSEALTEGIYTWNVKANFINKTGGYNFANSSNYTFTIDTTAPAITINEPVVNISITSKPYNISLNATISDTNLGSCYYYQGENVSNINFTCNSLVNIAFNNDGYYNITVYANDTAGNLNTTFIRYFANLINYSLNYTPSILEQQTTHFSFNLSSSAIYTANATLIYNNIPYEMGVVYSSGTNYYFNRSLITPEVPTDTPINFSVRYNLNGATGYTNNYTQLVYNVGNITINCTTPSLYFGLFDEEDLTAKIGTFEYNIQYGTDTNRHLINSYGKIIGSNYLPICVNTTLADNYTIGYGEIVYYATTYVNRRFYLYNGTILTNETQNISLYSLLDASQTSFKLEVEDTSLNPYVNKYTALLRWYPSLNDYKVADMGLTDTDGNTLIHVQSEDVDYRVGLYENNGTLIQLDNPTRFVCLVNPCTYTMRVDPSESDYTSLLGITYTLSFNETTGIWSFIYSDSSQRTTLMNMTIYRETSTTSYPVCTDSSSSYTGVLTCNTSTFTSGTLKAVVKREASPAVTLTTNIITLGSTAFKSGWGLFLSLLVAIPIVFTFALISPIFALAGVVIGLIPALYFGSINSIIFSSIIVLAVIVAHFLKRIS